MLKKLDYSASAHLLSPLVELGDSRYKFGDQLEGVGFTAFRATEEFFESFAQSEEELALHRRIEIERAKESFANPFKFQFELDSAGYVPPYKSTLLAELTEKNDPTGELRREISHTGEDGWRLEIDPCRRAYLKLDYDEREAHRHAIRKKFKSYREQEIARFYETPPTRPRYKDLDAENFARNTLESSLKRCGFEEKIRPSHRLPIIFSKALISGWTINFAMLGEQWGYDGYGYEVIDGKKVISPKHTRFHLDLRWGKKWSLYNKNLTYLPLEIIEFSPLGEFAYTTYEDMDEMAIGLLGYAHFYLMLSKAIEPKLIAALEELS